jgi:hypothetical protein
MYLATWKEYHSQTLQIQSVWRIAHKVVSTENFDSRYGGQNSLVSSDEEGAGLLKNQGFR